jgi:hypothetical protein
MRRGAADGKRNSCAGGGRTVKPHAFRGRIEAWQLHGVGLDDAEGLPEVLRAGMAVAYELMLR